MAAHHIDWSESCVTERPRMPWPNNNGRLRAFRKRWSGQRLWHVQGEALEGYLRIKAAIDNALKTYDILHEGCRVYEQILDIKCYMVGNHPGNVRPCIFIYCRDKDSLVRSRDAVMEDQEWQALRAEYPECFNIQPVLGKPAVVYLGRDLPEEDETTEVFFDPSFLWTIYGGSIHFKRSQKWTGGVFGGFVVIGEEVFGLTVAHCALDHGEESVPEPSLENTDTEELSSSEIDLLFPPDEESSGSIPPENEIYHRPSIDADSVVSMVPALSISSTNDPENDEPGLPECSESEEAVDQSRLDVLGHVDQMQTNAEDAAHWALIRITSARFISHFGQRSPDSSARLEHILHMRLDTIPRTRRYIASDVFLWISGIEHTGFLDPCPSMVRLPGHQNLLSLREVTIPTLCFRKTPSVSLCFVERFNTY